jgi:hypothetical protein
MSKYTQLLATTQNTTSNYVGEEAAGYYSAALLSAETIRNGAISVMPNIKYKENLPRLELSGIIKDRGCDFDDSGTVTYTETVITPEEFSVNLELCKQPYRSTWMAEQMGFSANDNLAPDFSRYLLSLVLDNVAAANEVTIWSGVTATAGEYDGFETLFLSQAAQPAAQEIAGTTLTAGNIIAQIALMVAQIPNTVYGKEDLNLLLPTSAVKFYITAMAALGYLDKFHVGQTELNYEGINIIHCPGMSNDVMFAVRASNFFFGTGILADMESSIRLIDRSVTEGDDNVRVVMNYTAAVQVKLPEEVVTYGIVNGGN